MLEAKTGARVRFAVAIKTLDPLNERIAANKLG
jgi:hypothetical protein